MKWRLYDWNKKSNGNFSFKTSHCLYEVLLKHQDGQLNCDIPVIISNHSDLAHIATDFHIPFFKVDPAKERSIRRRYAKILKNIYRFDLSCALYANIKPRIYSKMGT